MPRQLHGGRRKRKMVLQAYQNHNNHSNTCLILNITTTNGIWYGQNPLIESFPLLFTQLACIIFVTRALYFVLRPLHQPRIVSDILGGLLLGPSCLGRREYFSELFPVTSVMTLETVGCMALDFYVFLLGLEMDITSIKRATKRELNIAAAGALIPMGVGAGLFFLAEHLLHLPTDPSGCLFWGLTLTVTGFPVVARILEELKLLDSDTGRLALSTAMINDICSWILVAIVLPIRLSPKNAPSAITATIAFILVCIYTVRPVLVWIIRQTSNGNNSVYSNHYLCFVLIGVVLCSCVTELCGTYSIVGAFVFGIIIPDRELGGDLIERFADFVSWIMLPLFFAMCGIRINVHTVHNWLLAGMIVLLTSLLKIFSTLLVSLFYHMSFHDSLALGILMNTKGILSVVILNLGWDKRVLHDQEYAVIVVAIVVMTGVVAPIISAIYRSSTSLTRYKRRSIRCAKQDAELRILTCLHSVDDVPGIINLLNLSNATKESPIYVFALHLVELTGTASGMLIVHNTTKNGGSAQSRSDNSSSDQIINAFENFENQNSAISVQALTSLSTILTMHEDVCSLAEDKRIALMIVPFHKHDKLHCNSSFHEINLNILTNAPCSVGIYMDRGLGEPAAADEKSKNGILHIVTLFIGGLDDREALAYAWKMSGHPLVQLTVTRLLPGNNNVKQTKHPCSDALQNQLDDEFVNEFRLKTAGENNVSYSEKVVNSGEETIEVLRTIEIEKVDLYIVGRDVTASPVTAGLLEWCDYPEIGAMGDTLIFSDFITASVLVVHHYAGADGDPGMGLMHGSQRGSNNQIFRLN